MIATFGSACLPAGDAAARTAATARESGQRLSGGRGGRDNRPREKRRRSAGHPARSPVSRASEESGCAANFRSKSDHKASAARASSSSTIRSSAMASAASHSPAAGDRSSAAATGFAEIELPESRDLIAPRGWRRDDGSAVFIDELLRVVASAGGEQSHEERPPRLGRRRRFRLLAQQARQVGSAVLRARPRDRLPE